MPRFPCLQSVSTALLLPMHQASLEKHTLAGSEERLCPQLYRPAIEDGLCPLLPSMQFAPPTEQKRRHRLKQSIVLARLRFASARYPEGSSRLKLRVS